MSRRPDTSETTLRALLERGKEVPRQPDAVRARVLDRARATASAPLPLHTPDALPVTRFPRHLVASAAAAAFAIGVVGTVFALNGGWLGSNGTDRPVPPSAASSPSRTSSGAQPRSRDVTATPAPTVAPPAAEPSAEPRSQVEPSHAQRPSTGQSYNAELELMRSAHTAYAAHEYASALVLAGEHARRFPKGVLSEEREALRIRCLMGSGRTSEARRSAAAFEKRFPRSVLLERLKAEVGSAQ
jgi:hypothetical protein